MILEGAFKLLRPGGQLLIRDYGQFDMVSLRFPATQRLDDGLYYRYHQLTPSVHICVVQVPRPQDPMSNCRTAGYSHVIFMQSSDSQSAQFAVLDFKGEGMQVKWTGWHRHTGIFFQHCRSVNTLQQCWLSLHRSEVRLCQVDQQAQFEGNATSFRTGLLYKAMENQHTREANIRTTSPSSASRGIRSHHN